MIDPDTDPDTDPDPDFDSDGSFNFERTFVP